MLTKTNGSEKYSSRVGFICVVGVMNEIPEKKKQSCKDRERE